MKPGQIAQLQELQRCWMRPNERALVEYMAFWKCMLDPKTNKRAWLKIRRLWHQYRPQRVAMRKNRKAING
jgi:hypothetical protein